MADLFGIGLYTPAEASRLIAVPAATISRWLNGHEANDRFYEPLWRSQIDLGDGKTYLGFRDLMELRVADALMEFGVSAIRIRAAIELCREQYGIDRPLSAQHFKTDGRDIFLKVIERDSKGQSSERLLHTFERQYEFASVVEPSFKNVDFDKAGIPRLWWPIGRRGKIIVDPTRSFGQPIEESSSVPTAVLAAAGRQHGIAQAAKAYEVTPAAVRRAMGYEDGLRKDRAAA